MSAPSREEIEEMIKEAVGIAHQRISTVDDELRDLRATTIYCPNSVENLRKQYEKKIEILEARLRSLENRC